MSESSPYRLRCVDYGKKTGDCTTWLVYHTCCPQCKKGVSEKGSDIVKTD